MPFAVQPPQAMRQFRASLLTTIADTAAHMAQDAALTHEQGEQALKVLRSALDAATVTIRALSTSTTAAYDENDLPNDDLSALDRARHNLRILGALYGPKDGAA